MLICGGGGGTFSELHPDSASTPKLAWPRRTAAVFALHLLSADAATHLSMFVLVTVATTSCVSRKTQTSTRQTSGRVAARDVRPGAATGGSGFFSSPLAGQTV